MIRLSLLWGLVFFSVFYAWVDWFKTLLVLILLMAVYQHPDMPKEFLGIQGLNPWNLLLLGVCVGWLATHRRAQNPWDMPPHMMLLLALYIGVMLISSARAILDPDGLSNASYLYENRSQMVGELLVNTFKWLVVPILLFDGCRDARRFRQALFCVLLVYILIALQVVKYMPPQYAMDGEALAYRAIRVLEKGVGYHRVNLSVMLAGASWAIFATRLLPKVKSVQALAAFTALGCVYAQAMTAGRAGYLTWALVGMTLCILKWRKYLLAVPLVVIATVTLVPGVSERMLAGFTAETKDSNARIDNAPDRSFDLKDDGSGPDAYTITAGRTFIWPFVIEKILQEPWIGYGRLAMNRTGLTVDIYLKYGEGFPHPHNAYLEVLFDSGIAGAVCVLAFYIVIVLQSIGLFLDSRSVTAAAMGGACLAVVLSLLFGAIGSQSFYPREGSVGMWCLIGLMIRVRVQRTKALAALAKAAAAAARPRVASMRQRPGLPALIGARAADARQALEDLLWPDAAPVPVPAAGPSLVGPRFPNVPVARRAR